MWIDAMNVDRAEEGFVGFLIRVSDNSHGGEHYNISDRPAHTNRSHMPKLNGWCGETQNVSVTAEGLARVERITKNDRALVERVTDPEEVASALEELGYPDLAP